MLVLTLDDISSQGRVYMLVLVAPGKYNLFLSLVDNVKMVKCYIKIYMLSISQLDQGHLACRTQLLLPGPVAVVFNVLVFIVVVLFVVVLVIVVLVVVFLIIVVLVVICLFVTFLITSSMSTSTAAIAGPRGLPAATMHSCRKR